MFLFIKIIFLFSFGACFGSFINVLVDRGQKGKKISGRSQCDFCGYKLKWSDNVPILSFFFLGGKCRRCHKKLSWQYPIVEATAGFLFLLVGWQSGFLGSSVLDPLALIKMTDKNVMEESKILNQVQDDKQYVQDDKQYVQDDKQYVQDDNLDVGMTSNTIGMTENGVIPTEVEESKIPAYRQAGLDKLGMTNVITLVFLLFIAVIFLAIFLWDLKYMIIPDKLVIIGTAVTLIYYFYQFLISGHSIFNIHSIFLSNLIGGLIIFLFFWTMFYFSQGRWIGGGDVKLGFWIGFLVGWEKAYLMLLIAYVLGGLVAGVLILRKKKNLKSQIPFGPFLLAGCFMVLLWGDRIVQWYWKFLIF